MVTMTQLPVRHTWTRHDLEHLPEDGNRHELIDGVLVVSPAPRPVHQRAVVRLWRTIDDAGPQTVEAFVAPFDVVLADDSVIQPDVLVVTRSEVTDRGLTGPPLVAVEILSPSTRMIDLHVKMDRMRRAGCPHYWVVDPDEPSITAWVLRRSDAGPVYDEAGHAHGEETLTLAEPFDIEIVPARLVG